MKRKWTCSVFLTFLLLYPITSGAIPSVWGVWSWEFTENVHILVTPAASGTPLAAAHYPGGGQADATIRVQLWVDDGDTGTPNPQAVPNFPAEDIWLEIPGLNSCVGEVNADGPTDAQGWFTFSEPLGMGGWNDPSAGSPIVNVVVNGSILRQEDGSPISPSIMANSPDINGDLAVNLTDVAIFAADYYGDYRFASDLFWDGKINLSDVPVMAANIGAVCP